MNYDNNNERQQGQGPSPKKAALAGVVILVGFILLITVIIGLTNVGAGERAVVFHRDGSMDTLQPGKFQFVAPFFNSVTKYDVKSQTERVELNEENSAATVDGQDVYGAVVVLYHPDPQQVEWIHQNLGKDYEKKIVVPAINEAVKANTVKYKAADLFRNRPAIEADVSARLQERLADGRLVLDQVSITNLYFDQAYEDQIVKSQAAEQQLVFERNTLEIKRLQANQTIEEARGRAEATRLLSQSGQENLDYLMFIEWVKKWNGALPQWMNDSAESSILITPPQKVE